jgi:hypothetical protein
MMKKENDNQERSSVYGHTMLNMPNLVWSQKLTGSGLISTWMGDKSSKETAQRQIVKDKGGNAIKVQMESLMPDLSKITKA